MGKKIEYSPTNKWNLGSELFEPPMTYEELKAKEEEE